MKRLAMTFKDGSMGLRMQAPYKGKSTLQLIIEGKRTATSRDQNKPWNQHKLHIGEQIIFHDKNGTEVQCEVTELPRPIAEISPQEWAAAECWDEAVYHRLIKAGNYHQFKFKLSNHHLDKNDK